MYMKHTYEVYKAYIRSTCSIHMMYATVLSNIHMVAGSHAYETSFCLICRAGTDQRAVQDSQGTLVFILTSDYNFALARFVYV